MSVRLSVPICDILLLLHLSPLYDVPDHTNHIFSVRIRSWQCVSNIQDKYKDKDTHKDKYKDKDRKELLRKSLHVYALLTSYISYITGKLRTLSIIP